ncbi:aminotransferase class IV family protein [Ensifer sp. 2YAB10]|uniref:aminotransferase class IV family protein n=1 Tax=Ensifer TaxID=106591 RepID=UPI001CBECE4A|nr:aminotransferase class IV family protein [Ensifer adhaerens]MBZ7923244.1 aminotransferase class IV family protein [Ensifer adhaerens]UAX91823.1 aminotransferase class IV family protein [Ensifer adhaerens]UAX99451.1 aminotransferase class IV family protein [Ensifer adhaerens]UAY06834.1 aminotransferase class IV family protein [Ensifer adhaerens]
MTGFSLIETLRFEGETGFLRMRLHLARLKRSARRLGIPGAEGAEAALLAAVEGGDGAAARRVRLELFPDGRIEVRTAPFVPLPDDTIWQVRIAATRLNSRDPLLRYKTSRRATYETARGEFKASEADEVLLLNEKGEVCEGTITSVFLDDGSGILKTPPIACGLLAGVLRTELICQRRARVTRLSPADLTGGTLYVGNSLRGLIRVGLVI